MGIKKYIANQDNTITNAYGVDLSTRATGSNMGASDILETFSIYGQQTTSSAELSRILVQFPVSTVSSDRLAGTIPVSGSVKFYLRMFNARHSEQLPKDFTVNVLAVSQSWQEGYGLDMESYTDKTKDAIEGSNWANRNSLPAASWAQIGGDYHSSSYTPAETMPNYTYTFTGGEDMELDVTAAVEEWIAGTQTNNGFGVFLTSSYEAYVAEAATNVLQNLEGVKKSFYTKRFFSRSSEFFFKKPALEARWDSRITDDRGNFYYSSSLAPPEDNLNTIYLYNYIRGRLKNIPGVDTGPILVSIYSGSSDDSAPSDTKLELSLGGDVAAAADLNATGGHVSTGIYSASFAFTGSTSLKTIYDVWHSSGVEYVTGTISPKSFNSPGWNQYSEFTTKITNLKPSYNKDEIARFRTFVRERNTMPTIYNVASASPPMAIVPSASFEIIRMVDERTVIQNSTGSSDYHTYLSYDNSGSYFDLDMSLLEPGYMYGIKLALYSSNGWREQEEVHKFRVENN
jgi:hypothetical protein